MDNKTRIEKGARLIKIAYEQGKTEGATAEKERFELLKNQLLANIIALPAIHIGTALIDKKEVCKLITEDL